MTPYVNPVAKMGAIFSITQSGGSCRLSMPISNPKAGKQIMVVE